MDQSANHQRWPALEKDDEELQEELFSILTARAAGNAYGEDGSFAAKIATLPTGLRAMAATQCLDISLTLDSVTWHFGNFGEPHLVAETEAGLQELGLQELASCFAEGRDLMTPLLAQRSDTDGDPYEMLERAGLREQADEINRRAWTLGHPESNKSAIYAAWIRYARQHPERVFGH